MQFNSLKFINKFNSLIYPVRRTRLGRKLETFLRFKGKKFVSLGDTNSNFYRPGWTTCDLIDADYLIDLRECKLPFQDSSLDACHSSQLIEHISGQSGLQLFSEVYRCLKPGGFFRVSTPDMDKLIFRYRQEDWRFFLEADGNFILNRICKGYLPPEAILMHNRLVNWFASYSGRLDTGGGPIASQDIVNEKLNKLSKYQFREWCVSLLKPQRVYAHIHLYDYDELNKSLYSVGFSKVIKLAYGESYCSYMSSPVIDPVKHSIYSVYVEAIK